MKTARLLLPGFCLLAFAGCSNTNNPGSVLMTPFTMMGGLLKAVGRTVTQNEVEPETGAAIAARGAAIQQRGEYPGRGMNPPMGKSLENVAQR